MFSSGEVVERLGLLPEEHPPVLAPVLARRWYSGDLVFDQVEFEDEAEDEARRALEELGTIGHVKGVGASLRAAFGYALAHAVARELDVPVSPLEVRDHTLAIAEDGRAAVERLFARMIERREQHRADAETRLREAAAARYRSERAARGPAEQATDALDAAGAQMLQARTLSGNMLEVTFRFMGQRFISVVDQLTLQVHDSGICLDGADRELTLDSLPAAIREAVDTGQLHITRR